MLRAGAKRGPHEHPAGETPPAPRCLLEERVSAEVIGSVVDVVKALMGGSDRDWLVSARADSADKTAQFAVQDAPLWQALDKLLEAYGYDWGFAHGAVVCWPALIPARARPEVPEPLPEADAPASAGEPIEIAQLTPAECVLRRLFPTRGYIDSRPCLDARLRDFRLVGRMAGGDAARGIAQIAAALTAVVQGEPAEGSISMGAHMWLDRALRGVDARTAELKAQGVDLSDFPTHCLPLDDSLRALLTAQQWRLMDIGGLAVIWFREVPLDVAELWVITAKAGEAQWLMIPPTGGGHAVDWSRPDEFYATASWFQQTEFNPADGVWRVVGRRVNVGACVMAKCGVRRDP